MAIIAYRFSERPDLWERIVGLSQEVWSEYNLHGDVLSRYWRHLYDLFPEYQFVLYDHDADDVLAEAHTIPVAWDGELANLGSGIERADGGRTLPGLHASADLFQPPGQPNGTIACRNLSGITEQARRFIDLSALHIRLTEVDKSHSHVPGG